MLTYAVSSRLTSNELRHIRTYVFEIKLSEAIEYQLQNENEIFQGPSLTRLGEKVFRLLQNRNLLHNSRISTTDCRGIFEIIRDDPGLQTLAEQLSVEQYQHLEPLFSTVITAPTYKVVFSLHA